MIVHGLLPRGILGCKFVLSLVLFLLFVPPLRAQEAPYFVTYSDAFEEPGNLEIVYKGIDATPRNANGFNSAWWATGVYLSGQSTQNDSAVFTGFRWENRFRPLMRNYFINPVRYVEFEDIN